MYTYAKLGARFPSRGGAGQFLIRCFGDGVVAGGLNVFQFLEWIIAMALYAVGFAGYARSLLPWSTPEWAAKALGAGLIVAEAGRAILGRTGFVVIGAAALLATASGVNATLFGDANLAFMMARKGELPEVFHRRVWLGGTGGVFAAAGLTVTFVLFFPLSAVGQMASLAFLTIYGAVSFGHLRVRQETGAMAPMLVAAIALNAALFLLLLGYTVTTGPATTWVTLLVVLVLSFGVEIGYRKRTGRRLVRDSGSDRYRQLS